MLGDDRLWWQGWFTVLYLLNDDMISRCLFPDKAYIVETELHTFCDASEEAYAAIIYVHNTYTDGRVLVRQVKAVNKLAPTVSVPRLELNVAFLGSRLVRTVQKSNRSQIHWHLFWTDTSAARKSFNGNK